MKKNFDSAGWLYKLDELTPPIKDIASQANVKRYTANMLLVYNSLYRFTAAPEC